MLETHVPEYPINEIKLSTDGDIPMENNSGIGL
jgi:hypothetical protein